MRNQRWKRLKGDRCLYCGILADSDDHFPPQSVSHKGWLLPACRLCNSTLGARWHGNLDQRIEMAKAAIAQRAARLLKMPVWNQDDLDEMGPKMRREIELWQRRKRIAHERLAWNAEAYLAAIDRDSAFARFCAEIAGTRATAPES